MPENDRTPGQSCSRSPVTRGFVVGVRGFEPPASTSRTWRANQAALHPVAARHAIQRWRVLPPANSPADRRPRRPSRAAAPSVRPVPHRRPSPRCRRRRRGSRRRHVEGASASSGLTSQPSAPLRRARWRSARAIEQHQHRDVADDARRLVEAQRHRDRHRPHRADLEVEDREVGHPLGDLTGDGATLTAHGEVDVVVAECGGDLVDDPVGIGGKQDVHGPDATRRRPDGRRDARRSCSNPSRSWTSLSSNGSTTSRSPPTISASGAITVEFEIAHRAQRRDVVPQRAPASSSPAASRLGGSGDRVGRRAVRRTVGAHG